MRKTQWHTARLLALTPWTADGDPFLLLVTFSLRQDFLTTSACGFMVPTGRLLSWITSIRNTFYIL